MAGAGLSWSRGEWLNRSDGAPLAGAGLSWSRGEWLDSPLNRSDGAGLSWSPREWLNPPLNHSDGAPVCRMMGESVFLPFSVLSVWVLLPVCCAVLALGLRRARRGALSHAHFVTLQVVAVELVGIVGSAVYTSGLLLRHRYLRLWGFFFISLVFAVQTLFHCLACVERYVAVVYPVLYMGLPKALASRIRSSAAAFVWLLGLIWTLVVTLTRSYPLEVYFALLALTLALGVFCSGAVLHVLLHHGPRARADRTKRRAFSLILLIQLGQVLRFGGFVAVYGFIRSVHDQSVSCVFLNLSLFLLLPSSFLLPSLFLQGEARCGRNNRHSRTESSH